MRTTEGERLRQLRCCGCCSQPAPTAHPPAAALRSFTPNQGSSRTIASSQGPQPIPPGTPILMAAEVYAQTTPGLNNPVDLNYQCHGAPDCASATGGAVNFAAGMVNGTLWTAPHILRQCEIWTPGWGSLLAIVQSIGTSPVTVISTNQLEAEMQIIAQRATGARGSF